MINEGKACHTQTTYSTLLWLCSLHWQIIFTYCTHRIYSWFIHLPYQEVVTNFKNGSKQSLFFIPLKLQKLKLVICLASAKGPTFLLGNTYECKVFMHTSSLITRQYNHISITCYTCTYWHQIWNIMTARDKKFLTVLQFYDVGLYK